MTQITVCVQECNVEVKLKGRLTSGMVGVPVSFSFDDAWENLRILAVFRCLDKSFAVPLMDSMEITVPWEVMCDPGVLEIGAEGRSTDGGVVIPTVWAKVDKIYPGANGTNESALAATPKLYDRLMMLIENPPKRGVDYWTEADKQEIIEDVIADVGVDDSKVGNKPWSSKNTVDKLCPAFAVSGSAVTCNPVEGYPLTVQADEGATKVTRCGLNLWDEQWEKGSISTAISQQGTENYGKPDNSASAIENNIRSKNFIPVKAAVNLCVYTPQLLKVVYYDTNKQGYGITYPEQGGSFTPKQDGYIKFVMGGNVGSSPSITEYGNNICISINNGNEPVYEPYRGEDFAPGAPIPALDGINTIFADSGEITVSGRADPAVIIQDLCNKVNALSATVTALTGV